MANGLVMNAYPVGKMPQTLEKNNNTLKPIYTTKSSEYGGRKIRKVSDKEYYREVSMGKAPDTFPCGHVLCHKCIRQTMTPSIDGKLACPICGKEAARMYTADPGDSIGYNMSDVDNITLLSNFDDMVKKFDGLKYSIRRVRNESVQSRSLAMTFTNCGCHLCEEEHGTLQVLQEFNHLRVSHLRPQLPPPYYYRLCHGQVVTSFYSLVNSSCICVPCTYKELRESEHFPNLKLMSDDQAISNPRSVLTEVGKIIAKNTAPLESLHGKNVIEIDHTIKLQERADDFKFTDTIQRIKDMVNEQEQSLIKHASYMVQDKGGLIHIKGENTIEQNTNESIVW